MKARGKYWRRIRINRRMGQCKAMSTYTPLYEVTRQLVSCEKHYFLTLAYSLVLSPFVQWIIYGNDRLALFCLRAITEEEGDINKKGLRKNEHTRVTEIEKKEILKKKERKKEREQPDASCASIRDFPLRARLQERIKSFATMTSKFRQFKGGRDTRNGRSRKE